MTGAPGDQTPSALGHAEGFEGVLVVGVRALCAAGEAGGSRGVVEEVPTFRLHFTTIGTQTGASRSPRSVPSIHTLATQRAKVCFPL